MFQKAQAWAQAHEQIRLEAFAPIRCLREAANTMEAINQAEEWAARNLPQPVPVVDMLVRDTTTGALYYFYPDPYASLGSQLVPGHQLNPLPGFPAADPSKSYWVNP